MMITYFSSKAPTWFNSQVEAQGENVKNFNLIPLIHLRQKYLRIYAKNSKNRQKSIFLEDRV